MLTGNLDNLGNLSRVVPFDCLPGCRGHSSLHPTFPHVEDPFPRLSWLAKLSVTAASR